MIAMTAGLRWVMNVCLTRTAWAVFKYCGTKTAPLRRIFF
jgi:hypothetical protein